LASISKTKNGTWRVQLENRGKREYRTFKLKTHAQQFALQRGAELQRGQIATSRAAEKNTIGAVIDTYKERVSSLKRGKADPSALRALKANFGKTRFIALTSNDVAEYRDGRLALGRSPATVVKELNLLRSVIDYAIRDVGIFLPANVARIVKNPIVNNERDRVFYDGEEDLFFAPMTNVSLRAICLIALETACRLGELLELTWENTNLEKRIAKLAMTKNGEPRTIPLSPRAVEILNDYATAINPDPSSKRTSRIFTNWVASDSFSKTFRRAVNVAREKYLAQLTAQGQTPDAQMLEDLRFHDFRHIATSRLAKKIPNVIELSRITGHSDLRMLSRYYHITAEELAAKL
jgi:integrase